MRYTELLEKIDKLGGRNSYRVTSNKQYPWNAAYTLYSSQNPDKPIRLGCGSCSSKVYNWLKSMSIKELSEDKEVVINPFDSKTNEELKILYKEMTGKQRVSADVTREDMINELS